MNPFPHQTTGAQFMASRHSALLADEPGLGKTVTTILAAMSTPQASAPWLIVCPRNAVRQWKEELAKWAPGKTNYKITNPEKYKHIDMYEANQIGVLILDESHMFKNITSKRFRAFYPLTLNPLIRVYLLSGTPVWSYPVDLFGQLVLMRVVKLDQYSSFVAHFCNPTMKHWPGKGRFLDVRGASNLAQLRALCGDYILRRTWEEVGISMPPLTFTDHAVEADPGTDYDEAAADFSAWHLETAGRKAPPLSRFTVLRRMLAVAKLKAVQEKLSQDLQNGLKILVFSEFRECVEKLHRDNPASFLVEGGQTEAHRAKTLYDFVNGPSPSVLFATTKSLNVAVNLQAANLVYFVDFGFEPANFEQAFRRAWRMGQARPVNIVRFFIEGDKMEAFILKNILNKEAIQGRLGLASSSTVTRIREAA